MATKKTSKKTVKPAGDYIVVVAEYDDDWFSIDNALGFGTSEDAAKFITEDFNDTFSGMVETGFFDEDELLDEKAVLKKVKKLKIGDSAEWDTPEDTPALLKWKIFRKG